jgi:nicotinamidase-related amidase
MSTALIVTDMLNDYGHDDAEPLMASVREVVPVLAELIDEMRGRDIPVIYVNDNGGEWTAGRPQLVEQALAGPEPALVEPIVPPKDAPFIVKARHSVFYGTPLEYMLRQFGIERIILTGQVTEQCILYSALDAYVRHFEVAVPCDAVAHIHSDLAEAALRMMSMNMRATVTPATEI